MHGVLIEWPIGSMYKNDFVSIIPMKKKTNFYFRFAFQSQQLKRNINKNANQSLNTEKENTRKRLYIALKKYQQYV